MRGNDESMFQVEYIQMTERGSTEKFAAWAWK